MMKKELLLSSLCLMIGASSASAADFYAGGDSFLSEVRMGVMAHDVERREKGSAGIQAEVLFTPIFPLDETSSFWDRMLSPQPHLGASINTSGKTSYVYAGATWNIPVYRGIFVETSFGGAVHNGKLDNVNPNREPLGTRALFRESASIGFDYDRLRFMVTVEHLSNAGLGKWNHGLTNVGGRIGYKF